MISKISQVFQPISISLSPNTELDDVLLALKLAFQPWRWKKGKAIEDLEYEFAGYLGASFAVSFNSGRSSLMAILSSLSLEKGDEVLLQAFTCNAVPNPVLWQGLKPVYVDCNREDYNMSAEDLERKITPRSKAVIVQHTFGLPADIEKIQKICEKHNLVLIEDCAHALGVTYGSTSSPQGKGKFVGTFGKVSFFSFSRDKVISSVYGGMAVTSDPLLAQKLRKFQKEIGYPSLFWIKQQLAHPLLMNWLILPTYSILGKYLLVLFQLSHILSKAVHWKEKQGKKPGYFPKALPNALAELVLHQLPKLERFNIHRKELAEFYSSQLKGTSFTLPQSFPERKNIFLRYAIRHPKAHEIIRNAWNHNLLIGDWYTSTIAPDDTKLSLLEYEQGTCRSAEKLSRETLNLPTHINISKEDAKKVVEFLKQYAR